MFGELDNVGGPQLAEAFSLVTDRVSAQWIGMASNQHTIVDFEGERRSGSRKRLEVFAVRTPFDPDLQYLLQLLNAGEVDPQIGLRESWDNISIAARALLGRQVAGKAVLDVR